MRFGLGRGALAPLLIVAGLAVPAAAQDGAPDARAGGEWTGKYVCRQGVTGLRLVIQSSGENAKAVFHFFGLPENPRVPEGCYTMTGTFSRTSGNLTLTGVRWLKSPGPRFVMVGIQGTVDADGRNLSGNVVGAPNCSLVVLTRDEARRPLPRACAGEP